MQTFFPYKDFQRCAKCLDYRRLGKQRVEGYQIINTLEGRSDGWKNHPCVLMWRDYVDALKMYTNTMILEWIHRGYKNTLSLYKVNHYEIPSWLNKRLIDSHRSNLLRKNPEYYSQFRWKVPNDLPYHWPVSLRKEL